MGKKSKEWNLTLAFGTAFIFAGFVYIYEAISIVLKWNECHYFSIGLLSVIVGVVIILDYANKRKKK